MLVPIDWEYSESRASGPQHVQYQVSMIKNSQ